MKKVLLFYLLFFVLFSFVFLLSFRTPLLSGQTVLFYRGLGLLGIATLISGVLGGFVGKRLQIKAETIIAALIMSFSLHLAFFVVFPVTFDRSVTMYLLNNLNQTQRACTTPKKLETTFINKYVKEQKAIPRRIFEQGQIGLIEEKNNCVTVTQKTKSFLQFSELVKTLYGVK